MRTSSLCQHYLIIFSVRNDCLAVTAVSAFKIYATTNSSDEEFRWLLLLRPIAVELHLRGIPRSVAGHDGMCLVGICNFQARFIFISRDVILPKTEILGPVWTDYQSSCENQGGHRWPGFASLSLPMAAKVRCDLLFLVIHQWSYRKTEKPLLGPNFFWPSEQLNFWAHELFWWLQWPEMPLDQYEHCAWAKKHSKGSDWTGCIITHSLGKIKVHHLYLILIFVDINIRTGANTVQNNVVKIKGIESCK